ncbi:MAG: YkgJ family cysteine cluster protein [Sulfuricella sp.]|nr:YkgJ family cysteine cluster protein [Sulfuricella sp.]
MNTRNDTDNGLSISCATCKACCCRLEVMLIGDDGIPPEFTVQDQWGGWVMLRLGDGWCAALDRNTMLCTIYEHRPNICRDYQMGESDCMGERSGLVA